ncbi:MAG: GDSL-type esterase/lipase family protein [Planctomycetaceae bacterium]
MSQTGPRLTAVISTCVFLFLSSLPALAQTAPQQWFSVSSEAKAAGWYRWVLDGSVHPADEARLTLTCTARCSLYVNGQRLLRMEPLQTADGGLATRVWNISSLLRSGRNLVALEVQSESKSGAFGVSLSIRREKNWTVARGPWKTAPAPPPVGWQQTDFNDRDWREAASGPRPDNIAEPQISEKVESPVVPAPVRNTLPFAFEDGDHVCLVGATFIERAQLFEHLEATLAGTLGARRVTFRNLGWSADTVFAESRGIFDPPAAGYLRMVEQVRAEEPTVVLVSYGQNEALSAGMTPENFARQLGQFLDELAASGIPCVLVSPHELLPAQPPIPSPSRFNSRIRTYSESVGSVAQSRQLAFVDLFSDFTSQMVSNLRMLRPVDEKSTGNADFAPLADNGMHLTDLGYASAALVFRQRLLGIPALQPTISIDTSKQNVTATGAEVEKIVWNADGSQVTFSLRQKQLSPVPAAVAVSGATLAPAVPAADQNHHAGTPENPLRPVLPTRNGIAMLPGSTVPYESLRQLIRTKNELYFHRWRPQNITYLYGFRKHEQGNNAADIARFDPFVKELEGKIHAAQQPGVQTVVVTLTPPK